MKTNFYTFLIFWASFGFAQSTDILLPLIPKPLKVTQAEGEFILTKNTHFYSEDKLLVREMVFFNDYLKRNHGFEIMQTTNPFEKNAIKLLRSKDTTDSLKGSYQLVINSNKLTIKADTTGLFYAIQSLKNLFPMAVWKNSVEKIQIPCLKVEDAPRFGFRSF